MQYGSALVAPRVSYKEDIASALPIHVWLLDLTYSVNYAIQPLCYLFRRPNYSFSQQPPLLDMAENLLPPFAAISKVIPVLAV